MRALGYLVITGGVLLSTVCGSSAQPAAENGPAAAGTVVRQGTVPDDLYTFGGRVVVDASITGDAIAGAGELTFGGSTTGDLIAAGGRLAASGRIGGHMIVAGGWVSLDGPVAGKVVAIGGRVQFGRTAQVTDDVSVMAGSVEIAGRVGGTARVGAGHLLVLGSIDGDLDATAGDLEIGPGAHIGGRVIHRGPEPPRVAAGATVAGGVQHLPADVPSPPTINPGVVGGGATLLAFLGLLMLGGVLQSVFPDYTREAGRVVRAHPWSSLALGFAVLVAGPVALVLLMVTILGLPLAFAGWLMYFLAMLLGLVVTAFALGGWVTIQWPRLARGGRTRRLAPFALALAVLLLLGWLPVAGGAVIFLALVMGIGGATRSLFQLGETHPA